MHRLLPRVELTAHVSQGSLLVVFLLSVRGRGWEGGRVLPLLCELLWDAYPLRLSFFC